jgi:hypothetical protein
MNKELYRGAREEYYLVIELMRQFYSEPRAFRITGDFGDYRFIQYSNAGIVDKDLMLPDGTIRHRRPVFDILVSAEKQSPFSRAAQNETAKELYGMGLFAPENDIPALECLDMMDFEGKDKVMQQVQENGMRMRQMEAAMQFIQQISMMSPEIGQMAMQQGLVDPEAIQAAAKLLEGIHINIAEFISMYKERQRYVDKIRIMVFQQE